MKKNICISVIVLFVTLNMYSQELYEIKNMWGVSYGANVYYPRNKTFTTGYYDDYFKRYHVNYFKPQLTTGHFFEISRYYLVKNICKKNKLFVVPNIGIRQVKYYITSESYLSHNGYSSNLSYSDTLDIKHLMTNIGLKIDHFCFFENNNYLFYFLSINYNHQVDNMFKRLRNETQKSINLGFGLGYGIAFNKFSLSPFVQYELFERPEQFERINFMYPITNMYNNIQFGISFKF